MERKIAFCVGTWSAESTLFSWTFAKQFFLRKQRDQDGGETLSELDTLYVVHVVQHKRERWDAGGPILPRLSTALEKYPHKIVELEGRDVSQAIVDFAKREDIDVLIMGSREGKGAVQKMVPGSAVGSISETVKMRSSIPCLIIRPSAARNEKMRIKSMVNMEQLLEASNITPGQPLPGSMKASMLSAQTPPEPRKVCIAFELVEAGGNMISWATKHCLFPDDDIHLVHMTNRGPLEKMQKSASFQKAMLNKKPVEPPLEEGSVEDVGRDELQGYEEPRRTRLKGDAKAELCDYLGDQGIDLLIVGYSAANRFKKAFTGGSLSTHMMQHAHCPVVVLPLKSMSWEDQDTLSQIPELRPSASGMDSQPSTGLNENDATSPPPLHSLGPRVSMSRSLSQHISNMRRSHDTPLTSPSNPMPPRPDGFRSSFTGATQERRPSASGGGLAPLEPLAAAAPAPEPSQTGISPTSPFGNFSLQSQNSSESMDSQGHAARKARFAQNHGTPEAIIDQLRGQLQAKDTELTQLKAELRGLKFQLAAIQGSSSPNKITFGQ